MVTFTNTGLAHQLANLADDQGITVRALVRGLVAGGMDTCDEATIVEATNIHRQMVEATFTRARNFNRGLEVHAVPTVVELAPPPAKTREMGEVIRAKVLGYSATSVLRWMGANAWTFEDAGVVMATAGAARINDVTIRLQLKAGRDGQRGPAAPVTTAQAKKLREMAK